MKQFSIKFVIGCLYKKVTEKTNFGSCQSSMMHKWNLIILIINGSLFKKLVPYIKYGFLQSNFSCGTRIQW